MGSPSLWLEELQILLRRLNLKLWKALSTCYLSPGFLEQPTKAAHELGMVFLCLCDSSLVNKVFSILGKKKKKNASSLEEAIAPEIPSVLQHDVVIN